MITLILIAAMLATSCFGWNMFQPPEEMVKPMTFNEAIIEFLKSENYEEGQAYVAEEIDGYIFLIYKNITNIGKYFEDIGYAFYLPLGTKMASKEPLPKIKKLDIELITAVKVDNDYIVEISGNKAVDRKSIDDKEFPLKFYNNEGEELYALYDGNEKVLNRCTWIDVTKDGLPEEYAVYAEYNGEVLEIIDAPEIKKMVG